MIVLEQTGVPAYIRSQLEKCDRVSVDAEWYTPVHGQPCMYLTKQFTFSCEFQPVATIVLWNHDYPTPNPRTIHELHAEVEHFVAVMPCDVNSSTIHSLGLKLPARLKLAMYYSPKDIEAAVGRADWLTALLGTKGKPGTIKKLRNLTGSFKSGGIEFKLDDMLGMFNSSLDDAFKSVGVVNPWKDLATKGDRSKNRMNEFMASNPDEFLQYAVGDTVYLDEVLVKRTAQVNTIISEALDIEPPYTTADIPRSSGALVAKTFEHWMMSKYPDVYRSVLLLTDSGDNTLWTALKTIKDKLREGADLRVINTKLRDAEKYIHGLAMGSIRNYAMLSHCNTGVFGGMVQGGRCVNENPHTNPYDNVIHNVYDPDQRSCYGSALRAFQYPIGIPTLLEFGRDDKPMTVVQALKKYKSELVDGLWFMVVSGRTKFEQDLIPSKYGLSTATIMRKLTANVWTEESHFDDWGREIELAHLDGDFVHTLKQIENGIITADVLRVMALVANSQELSDLQQLQVVTLVYYPQSKQLSPDQWAEHIVKTKGDRKKLADGRSRHWCSIPLEEFVGQFVEYRGRVKKQWKRTGDEQLGLLQNSVKLFVNTTYGCLAAPYFPIGNTIVANNITARARVNAWLMSKALLSAQSITDGGMASYTKAAYIKPNSKLPGLNTLANRERFIAHRSVDVRPLTTEDVYQRMQKGTRTSDDEAWFDKLVEDHVNNFWANWDKPTSREKLRLSVGIEVKHDNTARKAVYFGSSDYLIWDSVGGKYKQGDIRYDMKVRGAKQDDHCKKLWMWHLLDPQKYPLPEPLYEYVELVGVSEYIKNPTSFGELTPGDEQVKTILHQPWNDGALCDTYATWKRRNDANEKAKQRHRKQGFGRFGFAKDIENGKIKPKR